MNVICGRFTIGIWFAALLTFSALAADDYVPGPDSKPQAGVPKGEVLHFTFDQSKIFPGTFRDYWVYVPAQYTPDKPACLFVCQDRVLFEATNVFDNLINRKEMPVTIGVFITPGRVRAADTNTALDRYNRSFEYDGLSDNYARFLLAELLPDVAKKKTSDGRPINISTNANDRSIGGSSSGAICAFTAAWERPDAFSRVFSAIGTFVDLRGGMRYPTLIRKYEPKPMRIFLQDGSDDNNRYGGDWWMANQTMERALVFAGYEVQHIWGDGQHSTKHATAIFPDAMRWLWKDWPQPVLSAGSSNETLKALLIPGEGWELVGQGYGFTEGPAVNATGEIFFTDIPQGKIRKVGLDGQISEFLTNSHAANGQAFGPDGRLYAAMTGTKQIVAFERGANIPVVVAEGIEGNDLVVAHNGNIYVTEPPPNTTNAPSLVWLIQPGGEKKVVDSGLKFANGVALSPDQTLLYVDDLRSHWVYSYLIQPDGTLTAKQRYFWLHVPDTEDDSGADGMRVDRAGRLYVATRMGIQVCDQPGRVQCILPTPNGRVANLTFGGPDFDTLYATCRDKVYKRQLKVQGANAWAPPVRPAPPRL